MTGDPPNVKGVFSKVFDRISNTLTGHGGRADAAANQYVGRVMITRQETVELYKHYWLARKIIDVPVKDMTRNGFCIKGLKPEQEKAFRKKWAELNCDAHISTAMKWSRLFGGSVIVPITNDVDLAAPNDPRNYVNERLARFIVVDATRLQGGASEIERDLKSTAYGMPRTFTFNRQTLDFSNLIPVYGPENPHDDFQKAQGGNMAADYWGTSMMGWIKEPVINAHSTISCIPSLLLRDNQDILKIPDLYSQLADCQDAGQAAVIQNAIVQRVQMLANFRSMHNVAILDDNESLERMSYSYAGIPAVVQEMELACAGAGDIPFTRLFGDSPSGLNATGEGDRDNYMQHIKAMQTDDYLPVLNPMIVYVQLATFGKVLPEMEWEINSPYSESREETMVRREKEIGILADAEEMQILPDHVIARRLQRIEFPELEESFINALEKESKPAKTREPEV